jgi:hypothetical protein
MVASAMVSRTDCDISYKASRMQHEDMGEIF